MRIESPVLARRAAKMERTRIEDVAHRSAKKVAPEARSLLRIAARSAGGSVQMARAVTIHDGHDNDLVMLQRGHAGDVLVGVSGSSPHADEAEALEWGGPEENPTFWVRGFVTDHGPALMRAWSAALTTELDRRCR